MTPYSDEPCLSGEDVCPEVPVEDCDPAVLMDDCADGLVEVDVITMGVYPGAVTTPLLIIT